MYRECVKFFHNQFYTDIPTRRKLGERGPTNDRTSTARQIKSNFSPYCFANPPNYLYFLNPYKAKPEMKKVPPSTNGTYSHRWAQRKGEGSRPTRAPHPRAEPASNQNKHGSTTVRFLVSRDNSPRRRVNARRGRGESGEKTRCQKSLVTCGNDPVWARWGRSVNCWTHPRIVVVAARTGARAAAAAQLWRGTLIDKPPAEGAWGCSSCLLLFRALAFGFFSRPFFSFRI